MLPLENLKFYFKQETKQVKRVFWLKKKKKKKNTKTTLIICNNTTKDSKSF